MRRSLLEKLSEKNLNDDKENQKRLIQKTLQRLICSKTMKDKYLSGAYASEGIKIKYFQSLGRKKKSIVFQAIYPWQIIYKKKSFSVEERYNFAWPAAELVCPAAAKM